MQAGGGGGQTCLSPAKNEVTRAFANHVRTFCYTSAQVRPVLVIAQLTLPYTRQVLPPSVMMLVKRHWVKIGFATKGINGSWDQTKWIEPCPKVSSTRLARRFFEDDGCGTS